MRKRVVPIPQINPFRPCRLFDWYRRNWPDMDDEPSQPHPLDPTDSTGFLNFTGLFTGSMAFIAVILGAIFSVDVMENLHWTRSAVLWGVVATLPMFLLLTITANVHWEPFERINEMMLDTLGVHLAKAQWWELLLIAGLAGVCEELLFRGFLQVWLEGYVGITAAILISGLAFGYAHYVSKLYLIITTAIGIYFSWLFDATGQRNLVVPIVAHGVYDFIAFYVVIYEYRQREKSRSQDQSPSPS